MTFNFCLLPPAIAAIAAIAAAFIKPGVRTSAVRAVFALAALGIAAAAWLTVNPAQTGSLLHCDGRTLFADILVSVTAAFALLLQDEREPAGKVPELASSMIFAAAAGLMLLVRAADSILFMSAFTLTAAALSVLAAAGPDAKTAAPVCVRGFYCGAFITLAALTGAVLVFAGAGTSVLASANGTGLFTAGALALCAALAFLAGAFPFSGVGRSMVQAAAAGPGLFLTAAVPAAALIALTRLVPPAHEGGLAGGFFFSALGALTAVTASAAGLYQTDMRRLAACVSVTASGWLIGLFSTGADTALALYFMAAFVPALAGLFAFADESARLTGSYGMPALNEVLRKAPFTAMAGLLFMAALAAFPFTPVFSAKLMVLKAVWLSPYPWLGAVLAGTLIATAVPFLKAASALLLAPQEPAQTNAPAVIPGIAAALLSVLTLAVIFNSGFLYTLCEFAAR